ncbi:MAG: hypothetical protein Q9168_003814 [Polycauliona sp. 1 TL-2023]
MENSDFPVMTRQYFEDSLQKMHDSLERRLTEYHTAVERTLGENTSYVQVESVQGPGLLKAMQSLIRSLWSLLEPNGKRSLQEFSEDPMGAIAFRVSDLEEQLKQSTAEKRTLEEEVSNYKTRLSTARKETADAKASAQRLSEQSSKYRNIILKGSKDDTEVPDERIHRQFIELRELIQRIVHRYYSAQGHRKLSMHNNPWFDTQKQLREAIKAHSTEPFQRICMRAKIFEMIDDSLLSARTFGVGEFEKGLMKFERALYSSKTVSHAALAEWRSRSIDCGAWLQERSHWPDTTCQEILECMDPFMLAATVGAASREQLRRSMHELCDKAYELSVLLRRGKSTTFQVWISEDESVVTPSIEGNVNCQAFVGASQPDAVGSKVVMTIFGGLVKIPEDSSGDRVILEKSHVICRV